MLLRSLSTPVLGTLISSIAESPNNYHGESIGVVKHQPAVVHHGIGKFPFHHTGSLRVTSISCNSSPVLSEFSNSDSHRGFRRAQSEGNLEGLVKATSNGYYDDLYNYGASLRREGRSRSSLLETIPSFSAFNFKDGYEDWEEEVNHHKDDIIEDDDEFEEWSCEDEVKSENAVEASEKCNGVAGVIDGIEYLGRNWSSAKESEAVAKKMYLAVGLGIDGGNLGGGNDSGRGCGGGGGRRGDMAPGNGENRNMEEYYKEMVEKNPGNSLFLRNYAQYLYKSKRDLEKAEEYYSRAILVDPNDGDMMAQYACLIWELHHDRERALSYFQRAVQVASEDSHVHAAYASFLWETEDNEETEEGASTSGYEFYPQYSSTMTSATA